jgi:hypothetical protein
MNVEHKLDTATFTLTMAKSDGKRQENLSFTSSCLDLT